MASTVPAPAFAPVGDKLPGFEKLSKLVYLYRPPVVTDAPPSSNPDRSPSGPSPSSSSSSSSFDDLGDNPSAQQGNNGGRPSNLSSNSPKLILIGGWMDAREAHLAKYTTKYQALFPATPILLVRSFAYHFTPGRRAKGFAGDIAPAVPAIQSIVSSCDNDDAKEGVVVMPKILIHVFSNGGSTILRHLYTLYNKEATGGTGTTAHGAGSSLPSRVTIFDSAPGRFQYSRSVYAFSMGFPYAKTPLFKYLFLKMVVHLLCASYWVMQLVAGRNGLLDCTFAGHNDPGVNKGDEVRRTYIYSREDRMVDFRDIEEHAAGARKKVAGEVRVEMFDGTAHVAHVRGDEDRYWRVVKESWDGGRS